MANESTIRVNIWVDVESTYTRYVSWYVQMLNHCMSRCCIYYLAQFL